MLSIKKIIALLLMILAATTQGQTVMSLDSILKEITANNPALQSFNTRAAAQEAKVAGAKAWMAPMIGAGTFMTPYPGADVMNPNDKGSWMFSVEQEIPNPLKQKAKQKALGAQSSITLAQRGVAVNELRAKARDFYYDILINYRKITIQKQNKGIMSTMKKLADIRYKYNQGALDQIFKAEGRIAEADNMILMSENEIRSRKIALNALMYRPAMTPLEIDTAAEVMFKPLVALDTVTLAGRRSDILQMDRSIEAMNLSIKQMRQDAKPDFRLRFEHMMPRASMMPNQFTFMGMLSIPIAPWSSGMYKSEVRAMTLEARAMEQQKAGMLTEMVGMSKAMESDLTSMQQQLANYATRILPALDKNLKASMLSYQENKETLAGVINAWEALNMTQMNFVDLQQRFYKMITDYEKSIER